VRRSVSRLQSMAKVVLTQSTNRFNVHRGSGSDERCWGGVVAAASAARRVSSKPWATTSDKGGGVRPYDETSTPQAPRYCNDAPTPSAFAGSAEFDGRLGSQAFLGSCRIALKSVHECGDETLGEPAREGLQVFVAKFLS
jgi:hypothetical protein